MCFECVCACGARVSQACVPASTRSYQGQDQAKAKVKAKVKAKTKVKAKVKAKMRAKRERVPEYVSVCVCVF